MTAASALLVALPPYSTTVIELGVLGGAISGMGTYFSLDDYTENRKETNQYREEHGIE